MNTIYRFALMMSFLLLIGTVHGKTSTITSTITTSNTPPDSTTKIIDKTAAAYGIEEGKTFYDQGRVRDALIKFRQASVKDPNNWRAPYWIGKCHYKMNNYGYSLKYLLVAQTVGKDKIVDELYYNLGRAYHRAGILDTAIINYELAIEKLPKSRSRALMIEHNINQCKFAQEQLKSEAKFKRTRMEGEINSGYDEYNVVIADTGNTLYFTSRRSNTTGGGLNPDDQRYFEDNYSMKYNSETGLWEDPSNELGKLNSEGFDALNWVSADGLYGIMTLNTTMVDVKKATRVSDLCIVKKNKQGKWNTPKPIANKTINTSFFEGAATLTSDGNTMYFVTDRKGEKSSTDIYVVHKNGKKWGNAKPLPDNVNTKSRETTPYITPDGRYLFFSSNGHLGMGDLDIFVCENLGDDKWSDPVNLGTDINTVNNDTHFVYSEKLKSAYLAGYHIIGNKASIDLYQIDMSNFTYPTAQ